ncbi:hypothetical protein HG531_013331 [Fusarium graminearum]|nr:hypothetical protein HG531_013331 [Fusarium graminearum]
MMVLGEECFELCGLFQSRAQTHPRTQLPLPLPLLGVFEQLVALQLRHNRVLHSPSHCLKGGFHVAGFLLRRFCRDARLALCPNIVVVVHLGDRMTVHHASAEVLYDEKDDELRARDQSFLWHHGFLFPSLNHEPARNLTSSSYLFRNHQSLWDQQVWAGLLKLGVSYDRKLHWLGEEALYLAQA